MRMPFKTCAMAAAVMCLMANAAFANSFVLSGVEFVGLNRVTPNSLQVVLPVLQGETMNDELLAQSIKSLYNTEQFSDIQAKIVGTQVVFYVKERPTIAELNFEGNTLIPKEALEQGLRQTGLAVGRVLKQSTVHAIENELESQYIAQGYYNSDIEIIQTPLDGNRVKLDMRFIEGNPARVVDINILGNQHFSDDEIKQILTLKESNWNKLSKADRYAKEKLTASLEALKAEYLNAGFVRFSIDNATLNINEDKNSVFIELKLTEGERYQFGQTQFLGNPKYPTDELRSLIAYQANSQYTQKQLDETSQAIAKKFGNDGYYNAQIRPVPRIDDTTRTVDIDYYIDPDRPIYVRRINFSGNIKTKDEVLRREMRQLEGALASNEKIQLSQMRLMRTGYFSDVVAQITPVPDSLDMIDINFVVEEQPSGSSTIAAGYSQSGGVTFQVDLSQNNFMGTGNKVNAAFSRSQTRDSYNLGITDPYFTENGVAQSVSAYYRKTKYDDRLISNYITDSFGGSLSYSYPIDENQRLSVGLNLDNTQIRGGGGMALANIKEMLDRGGQSSFKPDSTNFKNTYKTYNALLGWSYSSLDKPVFPTKGLNHDVSLTLGSGKGAYQKITYQGNAYYPLWKGTVLRGYTKLGYGNNLPFYENFYAGGYGSVRGYEASSLGPQSQSYQFVAAGKRTVRGEIIGGNALATFGTELILPLPFKGDWANQVRPVVFVEGGQVFDTTKLANKTIDIRTINPALSASLTDDIAILPLATKDNQLRFSAGVGATWYTPIGPISISYAKPIAAKAGDQTENLQFQIGSVF